MPNKAGSSESYLGSRWWAVKQILIQLIRVLIHTSGLIETNDLPRSQITLILAVFHLLPVLGTSKSHLLTMYYHFNYWWTWKHPIESDTTRWKEISSEFVDSLSVPIPKERPWAILHGEFIPGYLCTDGETDISFCIKPLVTLRDCNHNPHFLFWQKNEDIWKQVGFTKIS